MTLDDARAALRAAEPVTPELAATLPAKRPYPAHALPPALRDYVLAGAHALAVPPEMIASPLLAAAAAAIGTTRALRLQAGARGWRVFPILWVLIAARSGSKKSPALELGLEPLRVVDRALERASARAQETYRGELASFEAERATRARRRNRADDFAEAVEPAEPQRPPWRQAIASDVTIERLGALLADCPRGLLVARDELGAWLGSFGAYKAASAGDAAAWLELHRAGTLKVDRIGRDRVRVPLAAVSIAGGIQPDVLERIGAAHVDDGMLARFLICEPAQPPKTWREHGIADAVRESGDRVVAALAALEHDTRHAEDGTVELVPRELSLTRDAKTVWVAWYREHATRQARAEGPYAYALAKLEEAAARLALVVALAADPQAELIDETAMRAGVELARWHGEEAERLYARWETPREARATVELAEWVVRQGTAGVTAREVARHLRRYRGAGGSEEAERDLERLVASGALLRLPPGEQSSGRPTVRYATATSGDSPAPMLSPLASGDSVGVATVGTVVGGEREGAPAAPTALRAELAARLRARGLWQGGSS